MREQDFESILIKYPDLIEDGLILLGRQVPVFGRRIDILFQDENKRNLIVELKIGPIKDQHIGQALSYQGALLASNDPTTRVMLIGNIVALPVRRVLDHYGIAWRELKLSSIKEYLIMKRDDNLLQLIVDDDEELPQKRKPSEAKQTTISKEIEMPDDFACDKCRFSIAKLEEMSQKTGTGESFRTAGGRNKMWVREVDRTKGHVVFTRSTGKPTPELKIDKLKRIHDMIHEGKLDNDYKQIDEIIPLWGNYISAILKHLGCFGKRY